jgi:hypothetical protein
MMLEWTYKNGSLSASHQGLTLVKWHVDEAPGRELADMLNSAQELGRCLLPPIGTHLSGKAMSTVRTRISQNQR